MTRLAFGAKVRQAGQAAGGLRVLGEQRRQRGDADARARRG